LSIEKIEIINNLRYCEWCH